MDVRRQLDKSSRRRGRKRIVTVEMERTEPTSDEESERKQRKRLVTVPAASRGRADVFGDSDDDDDDDDSDADMSKGASKSPTGSQDKKQQAKDVWGSDDDEEED
jgi:RPA family protein